MMIVVLTNTIIMLQITPITSRYGRFIDLVNRINAVKTLNIFAVMNKLKSLLGISRTENKL
jgi:hypothetical protein